MTHKNNNKQNVKCKHKEEEMREFTWLGGNAYVHGQNMKVESSLNTVAKVQMQRSLIHSNILSTPHAPENVKSKQNQKQYVRTHSNPLFLATHTNGHYKREFTVHYLPSPLGHMGV